MPVCKGEKILKNTPQIIENKLQFDLTIFNDS